MSKLDELLEEILKETKRQEDERKEYIELIHNILENSTRKGLELTGNDENVWQLFFQLTKSRNSIFCTENIIKRTDHLKSDREDGLSEDAIEQIEHYYKEMDEAINYLYDIGKIDEFVDFLVKQALPLFLQNRHAPWYRNM